MVLTPRQLSSVFLELVLKGLSEAAVSPLLAPGRRTGALNINMQFEIANGVTADAEWVCEQDALIEHRKRLFSRLPKRGLLEGSNIQWEFWDGQQWQPYELPPPPFFFAITELPDPDAPGFKQPPC